jgi:hypothetical protein
MMHESALSAVSIRADPARESPLPLRPVTSAKDTSAPGAIPPKIPSAAVHMPLIAGPSNRFPGGLSDPVNEDIARAVYELILRENGQTREIEFNGDVQKSGSYRVIIAQFLYARRDDPIVSRFLTDSLRDWIEKVNEESEQLKRKWSGPIVKVRAQWLADP